MTKSALRLVFVHGWAFDAGVWQGLRAALDDFDTATVDLGFFGPPSGPVMPPDRPVIVIGHSLGALWLLKTRPFPWVGMVSINGFPRFVEGEGYEPAVHPRILERMIRRFQADPAGITEEFRNRCGVFGPLPDGPLPDPLLHGLNWLRDWDARDTARPDDPPVLSLSGGEDPVLPLGMDEHCFRAFADVRIERLSRGGHLLPVTDPEWCASRIRAFAAALAPGP